MTTPKAKYRREANVLSLQVLGIIKAIPTHILKRALSQFNTTTPSNCAWFIYRARGLATMIQGELEDRRIDAELKNRISKRVT